MVQMRAPAAGAVMKTRATACTLVVNDSATLVRAVSFRSRRTVARHPGAVMCPCRACGYPVPFAAAVFPLLVAEPVDAMLMHAASLGGCGVTFVHPVHPAWRLGRPNVRMLA